MNRGTLVRGLSVVAMIVMSAGVLGACRKSVRFVRPAKSSEPDRNGNVDRNALTHNVTIETGRSRVEILGSGSGWPKAIPEEVPEFTYGLITGGNGTVTPEGRSWEVTVGELQSDAVSHYASRLKEAGFQTSSMIMEDGEGGGGSVTASKGRLSVVVIPSKGTATISVVLKKMSGRS